MFLYLRRWHDDQCITSETFSKNVARISIGKSEKRADFGDRQEELLNVIVRFNDHRIEIYDDVADVEVN